MKKIRVRYAPSPTGHLHIGGARTALFNYLYAKHHNGDFIFRLEDTDIERNIEKGEESQLDNLAWLGVIPDESPLNPNPKYAPYRQMERLEIYNAIVERLKELGHAYECYCTAEELQAERERQEALGLAPMYNRNLISKEIQDERKKAGIQPSIRLRVPENKIYSFDDLIRGHVSFESKDIGDWVIVKSNGIPTYNFAVVVDDHYMEITNVFRGEEHISNTPKQLMLYEMLGWEAPTFAHMTLIVNEERKKLSKRDETIMQFISQYREEGYIPQAMFNFLSLLGWSPEVEEEIFSREKLIEIFDENRLSKSPSMFDKNKLKWINNRYMKDLDEKAYLELVRPFLTSYYDCSKKSQDWIDHLLLLYKDQLSYGKEIQGLVDIFFNQEIIFDDACKEVLAWETTPIVKNSFYQIISAVEDFNVETIKSAIKEVQKQTGIKGKPLFMGIRVLVSGSEHGPDLTQTLNLLGKETILKRLK